MPENEFNRMLQEKNHKKQDNNWRPHSRRQISLQNIEKGYLSIL